METDEWNCGADGAPRGLLVVYVAPLTHRGARGPIRVALKVKKGPRSAARIWLASSLWVRLCLSNLGNDCRVPAWKEAHVG